MGKKKPGKKRRSRSKKPNTSSLNTQSGQKQQAQPSKEPVKTVSLIMLRATLTLQAVIDGMLAPFAQRLNVYKERCAELQKKPVTQQQLESIVIPILESVVKYISTVERITHLLSVTKAAYSQPSANLDSTAVFKAIKNLYAQAKNISEQRLAFAQSAQQWNVQLDELQGSETAEQTLPFKNETIDKVLKDAHQLLELYNAKDEGITLDIDSINEEFVFIKRCCQYFMPSSEAGLVAIHAELLKANEACKTEKSTFEEDLFITNVEQKSFTTYYQTVIEKLKTHIAAMEKKHLLYVSYQDILSSHKSEMITEEQAKRLYEALHKAYMQMTQSDDFKLIHLTEEQFELPKEESLEQYKKRYVALQKRFKKLANIEDIKCKMQLMVAFLNDLKQFKTALGTLSLYKKEIIKDMPKKVKKVKKAKRKKKSKKRDVEVVVTSPQAQSPVVVKGGVVARPKQKLRTPVKPTEVDQSVEDNTPIKPKVDKATQDTLQKQIDLLMLYAAMFKEVNYGRIPDNMDVFKQYALSLESTKEFFSYAIAIIELLLQNKKRDLLSVGGALLEGCSLRPEEELSKYTQIVSKSKLFKASHTTQMINEEGGFPLQPLLPRFKPSS